MQFRLLANEFSLESAGLLALILPGPGSELGLLLPRSILSILISHD
jgi:hypothetical protein